MKQKVKLNNSIGFDLEKLIDTKLLIQANSGGGKSWAIRRIIEQAFGKVQIIVIDPEGEFTNLREKYDFVLAGQGGDAPAEPRSASMLAHRLLELRASAIIDLYELKPQERKHFVRLFIESMVNAPKNLWHDCLVIIDEADIFAPEKSEGESESLGPVLDLASRGRKRGYCMILATQRIPKLHKDASAECNNKLIGRASQDIDRKRAANEIGFYKKEQVLSLRELDPGEFYVFGPAISKEVVKIKVGDVVVKPPLRGQKGIEPPPPTAKVKELLKKLADLPEEAKKEAHTITEYKQQVRDLTVDIRKAKAHKCSVAPSQEVIGEAVRVSLKAQERIFKAREATTMKSRESLAKLLKDFMTRAEKTLELPAIHIKVPKFEVEKVKPFPALTPPPVIKKIANKEPVSVYEEDDNENVDTKPGKCATKIYSLLFNNPDSIFSRVQLGAMVGYSPRGGGFSNALSFLNSRRLIKKDGDRIGLGESVPEFATESAEAVDIEKWFSILGACPREIFKFLYERGGEEYSREEIAEAVGYSAEGGGFSNALSKLNALGFIKKEGRVIKLNPDLDNLFI